MSCHLSGVQTRIREEVGRSCVYIYCYAHRLNLVVVNTASSIHKVNDFFGYIVVTKAGLKPVDLATSDKKVAHRQALRNEYADNHTHHLDSGKYHHAKACNRAQKTAKWLAIDCWKLIFAPASSFNAENVSFLDTNLQLLDTNMIPLYCMGYCCKTYTLAFDLPSPVLFCKLSMVSVAG